MEFGLRSGVAMSVPIPPDLWHRRAAFDGRCHFSRERSDANAPAHRHNSRKHFEREREVRIAGRGDPRGTLNAAAFLSGAFWYGAG